MIGNVALGQFGPAATVVSRRRRRSDRRSVDHPVRVPNATFRDIGLFAHDEWDVTPTLRVTGGLRVDGYRVKTEATPGYTVASTRGRRDAADRSRHAAGRERRSHQPQRVHRRSRASCSGRSAR